MAAFAPGVDEGLDGCDEVFDAGEGAASDRLAGDDAEEDLDHVPPGARSQEVGMKCMVMRPVVR